MEQITLRFTASGQKLTSADCPYHLASNTVNYVRAAFDLDDTWQAFDAVRAEWSTNRHTISTVLDFNGECAVPHEVLEKLKKVSVNLVGSVTDEDALTDRLTTYPLEAVNVDAEAFVDGDNTAEVTPSEFDQYVQAVEDAVADIRDVDTVTLNDDYTLTFTFSSGDPVTVGPIRGAQGETGNGIASAVLNDDYTLTLTFTDGTSYTTSSIRGAQGPQGEPGEVTLAQLESVLPTDTASGAIASFPDGSDLFDYLSCVCEINPVQAGSGTPSPDNVRPITGWTGCEVDVVGFNQWDEEWEVGRYVNGAKDPVNNQIRCVNRIPVLPNTKYYFKNGSGEAAMQFLDADGAYISTAYRNNAEFTTPANAYFLVFAMNTAYGTTYNHDICINLSDASLNRTYTPYNPNSAVYNITWQTEAGTVYGGTVDLVSGVLTVTWANSQKKLSEMTTLTPLTNCDRYRLHAPFASVATETSTLWKCDTLEYKLNNLDNPHFYYSATQDNIELFVPRGMDTNTKIHFVAQLATPQTYQLDPVQVACLLGQNNVWADCGDIDEVKYKADVQRWVEKKLAE